MSRRVMSKRSAAGQLDVRSSGAVDAGIGAHWDEAH